jgi:signal transduction histidine kinase
MDRLRSEFIANVSHEIRTPLGLIKIFAATLLREDVELDVETYSDFLRNIDEEADKLTEIVDNLLDISRIEAGKMQLQRQTVDMVQMADKVAAAMLSQATKHKITVDFPEKPVLVIVDITRIEQVLRNLLSNAIKFSPDGGHIRIGGKRQHQQLLIWVRDEGIGIPTIDLERIFERFYRVQSESTYGVRGAGLGLSVSKAIIEAHGGRIWAESSGRGTTIYFNLPIVTERVTSKTQKESDENG